MKPDKIFSRLVTASSDKIPIRLVQEVLGNIHLNSLRKPHYGIATLKKPRKATFDFLGAVATRLKERDIIYKGGIIDFDTIDAYHLIRSYTTKIKPEDKLVIRIHESYFDYNLVRTFIKGKRMVYYATLDTSPVYIRYNEDWWFYLSPIEFEPEYFKLIKFNKDADLIDFFM